MDKIPKVAMPVVRAIRKYVKRPRFLPKAVSENLGYLRWYEIGGHMYCPMGLLPQAVVPLPAYEDDIYGLNIEREAIEAFGRWWDELIEDDAAAAVAAVWGEEKQGA